jgi:tetratricopeptide (TPR) repeat protein
MSSTPEALLKRGFEARKQHRRLEARQLFMEAVKAARAANDPASLAQAFTELGRIERDMHELDAARQRYEDAASVYRRLDEPLRLAHTVRHIGDILQDAGHLKQAAPCYIEALEIYRAREDTPALDLANAIRGFALLKGETGAREEAIALWREARSLYAQMDVQAGVADCEERIARLSRIA